MPDDAEGVVRFFVVDVRCGADVMNTPVGVVVLVGVVDVADEGVVGVGGVVGVFPFCAHCL
jgi:hypothetical protein